MMAETLSGNTFALEAVGFCLRFGVLHAQRLLGVTASVGGLRLTLCSVDLVHRSLDLGVRLDFRDRDLTDLVAEAGHVSGQLCLYGLSDVVLAVEDFVEGQLGHLQNERRRTRRSRSAPWA